MSGKALVVLSEPRSLFDDMSHAYDDAAGRAKGSSIPVDGLYAEPGAVSFGEGSAQPTCPSCAWAGTWTTSCR